MIDIWLESKKFGKVFELSNKLFQIFQAVFGMLRMQKIFAPPKEKILTSMEELIQNFMIVTEGPQIPAGEVYFEAENPKGALGFYIVSKGGGVPYRLKIRAPSFCNLSILEKMVPGHMLSDITVILGSLDFVMGECDR